MPFVADVFCSKGVREAYIPAQHDTQHSSHLATIQAHADLLAKEATSATHPSGLPTFSGLAWGPQLMIRGLLVTQPRASLDALYKDKLPRYIGLPSAFSLPPSPTWAHLIQKKQLSWGEVSMCLWIRSAALLPTVPNAYCPFCKLHIPDLPEHLRSRCLKLSLLAALSFRTAVYTPLAGWSITMDDPWCASCSHRGSKFQIRLCWDGF
eukprot:EG_transcript_26442